MKVVSEEHFETMKKMAGYFECHAATDETYIPEAEASKRINEIIRGAAAPAAADFAEIRKILAGTDLTEHANGSAWLDYKIHVAAILRVNGANGDDMI